MPSSDTYVINLCLKYVKNDNQDNEEVSHFKEDTVGSDKDLGKS